MQRHNYYTLNPLLHTEQQVNHKDYAKSWRSWGTWEVETRSSYKDTKTTTLYNYITRAIRTILSHDGESLGPTHPRSFPGVKSV